MRILKEIEIEEKKTTALFDTGAIHTYIENYLVQNMPIQVLDRPYKVGLGGAEIIEVKKHCLIQGKIEGLEFATSAIPVDDLGKADGKKIDIIIGALTMEEWELIPNPKDGTLDLSGLKRRTFIEY